VLAAQKNIKSFSASFIPRFGQIFVLLSSQDSSG